MRDDFELFAITVLTSEVEPAAGDVQRIAEVVTDDICKLFKAFVPLLLFLFVAFAFGDIAECQQRSALSAIASEYRSLYFDIPSVVRLKHRRLGSCSAIFTRRRWW